MFIRNCSLF